MKQRASTGQPAAGNQSTRRLQGTGNAPIDALLLASAGETRRLLSIEDIVALSRFQKSKVYEWMNRPLTDPLRLPWVKLEGGRRVKYADFAAWYDRLQSE